mmetsp:Transcript_26470/g.86807  ORF Transcript_26470/g.86807 Transcript_26470/m.86807 type:complete len:141 (+) Transcript_26470:67-489(+)
MSFAGGAAGAGLGAADPRARTARLPPEVNRALYVRNLPRKITAEEMYDIFGKFGAIRQIRLGCTKATMGTAFVIYEDIYDAKAACDHLSGFNVANRYLIVLYYREGQVGKRQEMAKKEEELKQMQKKHGVTGEEKPAGAA